MVFTQYMTNYLNRYVKINGKNCKKKKKQIDDIENYYTEIIYNKINQITKVLNEEEKLKLAKELFLHYKQSYKDDRSYYLSVYIQNRISRMFDCNKRNTVEDKILLTYSFYIGMTDKIHQYFFEKYALVAKKLGVTYKDSDFDSFISEFISKKNYSQHSINNAMENNLKFLLETQNQDLVKKKPPEIKDGKMLIESIIHT